jgi:phospholipid/cholesterol/gamma-HCH transport system substrate-binding protein
MIQILQWLNRPLDGALQAIDEFRKSQLYGPEFVDAVVRLLTNAGLSPEGNTGLQFVVGPRPTDRHDSDIDAAMDRAFTNIDDYFDAFKLVPAFWENIPEPPDDGQALPCSQGRFELPAPMDVLVNGQKVVLCKR